MPRPTRIDIPGIPQHVIQRGNDRQPCFFADADYLRYRTDLREIALREGCAIHAYVLMTNHVHLLVTPGSQGAIGRMMQSLGRRYVRSVNDRYHRTGTLWEGRYKACPVEDGTYLMHCHRYIELNPLRAAMVTDPADYPWSSHRCNTSGTCDPLISHHRSYLSISRDPDERRARYRAFVMETVSAHELDAIRGHVQRQHAFGTSRFREAIEAQLGRPAGPRKIGRPRKAEASAESAL
jgi:putative transposase